jgi:hypothetical protein
LLFLKDPYSLQTRPEKSQKNPRATFEPIPDPLRRKTGFPGASFLNLQNKRKNKKKSVKRPPYRT